MKNVETPSIRKSAFDHSSQISDEFITETVHIGDTARFLSKQPERKMAPWKTFTLSPAISIEALGPVIYQHQIDSLDDRTWISDAVIDFVLSITVNEKFTQDQYVMYTDNTARLNIKEDELLSGEWLYLQF